jgi:glycyl-tRNA synthetase alpha chain
MASFECKPVSVELTYGLERICMFTQGKDNVFELVWNNSGVKYKDIFLQAEKEYSAYNFEHANTEFLLKNFEIAETECKSLLQKKLSLPAYDQCLKASHVFNLLDSRGVIGVAQRTEYIARIRELAKGSGQIWLESQK